MSSRFEETLRELLAAGYGARFRASGDSMYPTIRSGDHLHIAPCKAHDLLRGDVALAETERGLTAHRVVRIAREGDTVRITTRGDNAVANDRPISVKQVLGRVARIERDGSSWPLLDERVRIHRRAAALGRRLRCQIQQWVSGWRSEVTFSADRDRARRSSRRKEMTKT